MASIEKSACLGAGASTKQHAMLRRAPAAPDAAVGPQTSLGWRRRALNRSPTQCEDDRGTRPGDNEKSPRAPSIVIQRSIGWRGGRGLTLADTGLDGGELNARMLDGLRFEDPCASDGGRAAWRPRSPAVRRACRA